MNLHICKEENGKKLYSLCNLINIDICAISETWIKENRKNEFIKIINENKYEWFSRERTKQRSNHGEGGIGVLVKKSIGKVQVVKRSKNYEMMWIEITRHEERIYIAVVYMSPEGSARSVDSNLQFAELEVDINNYTKQGQVIVMGDFNGR